VLTGFGHLYWNVDPDRLALLGTTLRRLVLLELKPITHKEPKSTQNLLTVISAFPQLETLGIYAGTSLTLVNLGAAYLCPLCRHVVYFTNYSQTQELVRRLLRSLVRLACEFSHRQVPSHKPTTCGIKHWSSPRQRPPLSHLPYFSYIGAP